MASVHYRGSILVNLYGNIETLSVAQSGFMTNFAEIENG